MLLQKGKIAVELVEARVDSSKCSHTSDFNMQTLLTRLPQLNLAFERPEQAARAVCSLRYGSVQVKKLRCNGEIAATICDVRGLFWAMVYILPLELHQFATSTIETGDISEPYR